MNATVPSPCTGICRLNEDRVCSGCGRLLAEIAAWSTASDDERREIRRLAEQRMKLQNVKKT